MCNRCKLDFGLMFVTGYLLNLNKEFDRCMYETCIAQYYQQVKNHEYNQ